MFESRVLVALSCILSSQCGRTDPVPWGQYVVDRCTQNSVTPVSCAEVNSPDSLVPHPDDCQLFYYCVQPYLPPVCRQCPVGLHFNPLLHVCDWPNQAGCALTPSTDERCTRSSVTPVYCSEVDTPDGLVPHPDDCHLFYYCVQPYLAPVCRQCPADLHFNPTLRVCDWPYRAGCALADNTTDVLDTTEWAWENETTTQLDSDNEITSETDAGSWNDTAGSAEYPLVKEDN